MKFLVLIIFLISLLVPFSVTADWSIADPSDSSNTEYIEDAEAQGYWNFEWDPSNPISAAIPCCWWELVHGKATKKYWSALANESSDSSSDDSSSSVETKSYCPACDFDESYASLSDSEIQEISDQLMTTKPWLKEGKNNTATKTTSNVMNTSPNKIFSFGTPVKT